MRKITMLTFLTITLLAANGCGWPRSLCRGDACGNACEGTTMSPSLMPPTSYGPTYLPSYQPGTMELPGPATTISPTG